MTVGGWLRDWWHVITGVLAALAYAAREVVVRPRQRISTVEAKLDAQAGALDRLSEGIDEVRVAQTRMSDAHVQAIREVRAEQAAELGRMHGDLTSRMDQIVALMIGGTHTHRRRDDEEEGL